MDQPNLEGTIGAQVFTCPVCGVKLEPEVAKGNFYPYCGSQVVFRKVSPWLKRIGCETLEHV